MEFVTDHTLTISAFDFVMDTAGIFFLIAPYRMTRLFWPYCLPFELALYALSAVYMEYYYIWEHRLLVILGINVTFLIITYWVNPFSEHAGE